MKIQYIDISQIKNYPKNAKKHPQAQIENIANSIKEFGFLQPVVVDNDNNLIVGHGRVEAAKLLGLKEVPAVSASSLTKEQVKAYRLADNKLNESDWDMALVLEELGELDIFFQELTGFDLSVPEDSNMNLGEKLGKTYEVIVECEDETTQEKAFNEINKLGYKCRLLTL